MQPESKQPFNAQALIDQAKRDEFYKKAQADAVTHTVSSGRNKGKVQKNHSVPRYYRQIDD